MKTAFVIAICLATVLFCQSSHAEVTPRQLFGLGLSSGSSGYQSSGGYSNYGASGYGGGYGRPGFGYGGGYPGYGGGYGGYGGGYGSSYGASSAYQQGSGYQQGSSFGLGIGRRWTDIDNNSQNIKTREEKKIASQKVKNMTRQCNSQ